MHRRLIFETLQILLAKSHARSPTNDSNRKLPLDTSTKPLIWPIMPIMVEPYRQMFVRMTDAPTKPNQFGPSG